MNLNGQKQKMTRIPVFPKMRWEDIPEQCECYTKNKQKNFQKGEIVLKQY